MLLSFIFNNLELIEMLVNTLGSFFWFNPYFHYSFIKVYDLPFMFKFFMSKYDEKYTLTV